MARNSMEPRPKAFPPPVFPPRKRPLFSRTPPAVFPVLLGLAGLAMALRVASMALEAPRAVADLAARLAVPLWALGLLAYSAKMMRRSGVLLDDLKVMPSRIGLSAATLGGLVVAGLLVPVAPTLAMGLLFASLAAHAILAGYTVIALCALPPEGRKVNPGWHMTFVGFVVGAPAAHALGLDGLATVLLFATMPIAVAIWTASCMEFTRQVPPAPLRPLLAIHLAPASLFALTSAQIGQDLLASIFAWLVVCGLVGLAVSLRWITASGFSPLWGAFTFPLSAASSALTVQGGALGWLGLSVLTVTSVVVPWIAWKVLRLWPGGKLADKTNAAEA